MPLRPMNSPGPSATDIQSHLYNSFIQASTYDVEIRVSGTWSATYKLHRVVLIQSSFFRSLFTEGFSESVSRNVTDKISITFDDYNITRPAFEICISRLYGGGPLLHVSPNLIPTTNYPLTPPYSNVIESEHVPTGMQPASPRFLLSLLATAIYLSIPTVASQALSLILKSVGPRTVLQYLDFACGKCLGYCRPLPEDFKPAVGLENVALMLDEEDASRSIRSIQGLKSQPSVDSDSSLSPTADSNSLELSDGEIDDIEPSYHYGAVSDKIGEACACWLARWAMDMLELDSHTSTDSRMRSKSMSSIEDTNSISPESISSVLSPATHKTPIIWGRSGLSAKWVATFVSADTLFVKNERERYEFARTVVELRRKDGILDEEEAVWTTMFDHAIHYINMTFDDILFISQDISPTTKQPYVPLSVLQAVHWTQALFQHHITGRPNNSTNTNNSTSGPGNASPPPREKELGMILTTANILSTLTGAGRSADGKKLYYPVFTDQSLRIGDGGTSLPTAAAATNISMEDLFAPSQHPVPKHLRSIHATTPTGKIPTTEDKFFGLLTPKFTAQDCVNADATGKARWSPYPPYRFSVEFWDVDLLKEKSRLHSQTVWYAGSLFNIYVQLVRKKGQAQLGIYLHRQSHVDPIPASSRAPPATSNHNCLSDRPHHHRQPSLPSLTQAIPPSPHIPNHYSPSIHPLARNNTPASQRNGASPPSPPSSSPPATAPLGYGHIPATFTNPAPRQPYRDPRTAISAYFAVSCASATGSSQTRFSSSPDTFSVSQSWGWKSSSLRTEEFLEVGMQPLPDSMVRGKEVSLRATVVMGLV